MQGLDAAHEDNGAARGRLMIVDDRQDADLPARSTGAHPDCHFFLADSDTGLDEDLTRAILALA